MKKYSFWDFRLIKALYVYESYEVDGYPVWVQESPDVSFAVEKRVIKSAAAVERAQNAYNKGLKPGQDPQPGLRHAPRLVLAKGAEFPSRKAWLEGLQARNVGNQDAIDAEQLRASRAVSEERGKDFMANLDPETVASLSAELGLDLG